MLPVDFARKLSQSGFKRMLIAVMLLVLGSCLVTFVCRSTDKNEYARHVDAEALNFYRQQSVYTHPGEYAHYYKGLPEALPELCRLIKAQLIHPMDLPLHPELMYGRNCDDAYYPTVAKMLAGLTKYNPAGLTPERKSDERLIVSCRYHAVFLASILKDRGVPTRVRYGFAHYWSESTLYYHVICEVWNDAEKRWMLVDPDRQMIDIPRDKFDSAADVWFKFQKGEVTAANLEGRDETYVLGALCHDLAAVLGNEPVYWNQPPVVTQARTNGSDASTGHREVITKVATLLLNPDGNFYELKRMYAEHEVLQFRH